MTGSDLNSSAKPWDTQFRTSKVVYAEFHEQVYIYIYTNKYLVLYRHESTFCPFLVFSHFSKFSSLTYLDHAYL